VTPDVWVCPADGPVLRAEGDVLELIFEAGRSGAFWVAIPVSRLGEEFFQLRTGLAGAILQKFVNYRTGLAVVGDIARYTAASESFSGLVRESNRGRQVRFVPDLDSLDVSRSSLPAGW
jgi:hypothetical protein